MAIRAKSQRRAPRSYEKKLDRYFKNIDDFNPEPLVKQIPALNRLLEARQQLRDLLAKLDGNDELDKLLEDIVQNTEGLQQLKAAAGDETPAS